MPTETIGLVLMSVAILQYGLVPLFADLNATHARNARWTSHARFHVVTQVLTGAAIASLALYARLAPGMTRSAGVCLAATLGFCGLGAFFASADCRALYGGALRDPAGGMPRVRNIDLNVLNFGIALLLLVAGRLLLL